MNKRDEIRDKALQDLQTLGRPDAGRPLRFRQRVSRARVPESASAVPLPVDDLALRPGSARCAAAAIVRADRGRRRPGDRAGRCSRTPLRACSTAGAASRSRRACSRRSTPTPAGDPTLRRILPPQLARQARAAGRRRAEHRADACAVRRARARGRRHGARHGRDLRPPRQPRRPRRAEHRARGDQAGENYAAAACPLCRDGRGITEF